MTNATNPKPQRPPRVLICPSVEGDSWAQAFIIPKGMSFSKAENLIKAAIAKAVAKDPDEWNIDDVFRILAKEGQGIQRPSQKDVTDWCWDLD